MNKLGGVQIAWTDDYGNVIQMSNASDKVRVQVFSQRKDVDARGVSIPLEVLEEMVSNMKGGSR